MWKLPKEDKREPEWVQDVSKNWGKWDQATTRPLQLVYSVWSSCSWTTAPYWSAAVVMLRMGSEMVPYTLGQIDYSEECMAGSWLRCVKMIYGPICPLRSWEHLHHKRRVKTLAVAQKHIVLTWRALIGTQLFSICLCSPCLPPCVPPPPERLLSWRSN